MLALVPLLLGVLLSWWLLDAGHERARLRADAALRASVASSVLQVDLAIREQLEQAAGGTGSPGTTVSVSAVTTAGVSLSSVIGARDSGAPALDDVGSPPSIVVPVYRTAGPPGTTAERRAGITAYRILPLALTQVLAKLVPDDGGLVVRSATRAVVAEPGPAPRGARSFAVDLEVEGTSGWTLQGWLRPGGTSTGTWLLVAGLLAALGGFAVVLVRKQRSVSAARSRLDEAERHGTLVSGLAPVVQGSLDLGEVIPSASAHLAEGLALAGLSLAVPGTSGERQLFAWGATPDPAVTPVAVPPAQLEPGDTFAMSLARGGRVLGLLRVRAGAPLTLADLRALSTASELLGSTLANAEAFAQQQTVVERLQAVDELKTVFLATASHELRTPVTAIVGFSTLVLQQWEDGRRDQARAYLERVVANGHALEALIEQLLDFSRLERGIRPSAGELLDLATATSKSLTEQPELTAEHHLRLRTDDECLMRGSGPAVARIVTNLVGNAAKYSPAGTTITVTVQRDGDRVQLLVDDEGPGVPVADRERIFSRFYRGRGDEVASTRGAGIGLAIVAEFAASMSGAAAVGHAPSGGARFSVSFPAAAALTGTDNEGASHVRLA